MIKMLYDHLDSSKISEGLRSDIEKYKKSSNHEKYNKPLLYYLLGDDLSPYKSTAEDSGYGKQPDDIDKNISCATCKNLYLNIKENKFVCSHVDIDIKKENLSYTCFMWNV